MPWCYESLKKHNPDALMGVLITQDVDHKHEKIADAYGLNVIRDDEILVNKQDLGGSHRWHYTFDKMKIFRLPFDDKLVYLDSDMYVNDSLGNLFEFSHFSAVKNRKPQPLLGGKKYFNSGLMVIKPDEKVFEDIVSLTPSVIRLYKENNAAFGDQNILNHYMLNWPENPELALQDKYNVFWGSICEYLKNGYSLTGKNKKIAVIHYTGKYKPWLNYWQVFSRSCWRSVRAGSVRGLIVSVRHLIDYKLVMSRVKNKISEIEMQRV